MKKFLFATLIAALPYAYAVTTQTYAGQEKRNIKALSTDEVNSLLAGKGMGLAKAAELNGFPGPAHVLELSKELVLSDDQKEKTKVLFEIMDASAKKKGAELVAAEQELDALFKSKQITVETLNVQLQKIASLQAQVRASHLAAHLEQTSLLTVAQVTKYNEFRGYTSNQPAGHEHGKAHH